MEKQNQTNNNSAGKITIIGFVVLILVLGGILGGAALNKFLANKPLVIKSETIGKVKSYNINSDLYTYIFSFYKQKQEQDENIDATSQKVIDFWKTKKYDNKSAKDLLTDTSEKTAQVYTFYIEQAKAKKMLLTGTAREKKLEELRKTLEQNYAGKDYKKEIEKAYHISYDGYENIMIGFDAYSTYINKVQADYLKTVKDSDVKAYRTKNAKEFTTANVSHVLIKTTDASGKELGKADLAKAKAQAEKVLKLAKGGQSMLSLAKKYSADVDQSGKPNPDGKFDVVAGQQKYVSEFEDWALGHNKGEYGLVKSQFGYHVMKVNSVTLADLKTVKTKMGQDYFQKAYEKAYGDTKSFTFDKAKVNAINEKLFNYVIPVEPTQAPTAAATAGN